MDGGGTDTAVDKGSVVSLVGRYCLPPKNLSSLPLMGDLPFNWHSGASSTPQSRLLESYSAPFLSNHIDFD